MGPGEGGHMRHIVNGIKDLKRHLLLIIIFVVLYKMICVSFVNRLYSYSDSGRPYERVMNLQNDTLFSLQTFSQGEKKVTDVNAMVTDLIHNDKAVIITSYTDPQMNSYIVYVVGEPYELLSVSSDPEARTPYAYAGAKTSLHEGDFILSGDINTLRIPVTKRMPKGAWCFNGNGIETETLDQYTVIFLSLEDYLMNYWHNELTQWIYLRNCTFEEIRSLLEICTEGNLKTNGDFMRSMAEKRFPTSSLGSNRILFSLFTAGGIFLILTLFIILYMVAESNTKAYLVHLIYGGRPIHIFIRALTSSLVLITLPMCWAVSEYYINDFSELLQWDMLGGWYVKTYLVSAAVCLIISLYTVFRFVRNDYASFIHVKE